MIENKIKLDFLSRGILQFSLEGIKITHSNAGSETVSLTVWSIERAVNEGTNFRCHASIEQKEID